MQHNTGCSALELIDMLFPASVVYLLETDSLDKAVGVFCGLNGVTKQNLQERVYACIAQIIWDKQARLDGKAPWLRSL